MAIDKIFDGAVDGIADNLFNSVSNSVSEIKAMQQRKAAENVQLVVQALKKIDADIREKYDGVTETFDKRIASIKDGRDGKDGKNGLDGVNGKDGRDGKDGRNGRDGLTGPRGFDGPKGIDGKDGRDGEDGVSVTDAHIDFDGSLIISLSSGRVINVGEVVAADIAEKIKVITNGGGTSQPVLDQLASLQAQIDLIASALVYKGTWNASTNTPTLTSSVGTANSFYIVSVAGTTNLNGTSNWGVGDWAVFNGSVWQRVEGGAVGNFTDLTVSGTTTLSNLTASTALALNASKEVVSVTNTGTGNNVLATSPTLVTPALGTPSSATLTNATGLPLSSGVTGTLPILNGGTGQTTANAAFNALAPSQTSNSGKYLTTNGTDTSWATLSGVGTVTSVSGTGTVNGLTLTGTVTTSGSLTLGGTLSGISNAALTNSSITINGTATSLGGSINVGTVTSVAASVPSFLSITESPITSSGTLAISLSGTALPTTSGGTGLTSFTANGVVYASSSSALTTGSALTFDGSKLVNTGYNKSTYQVSTNNVGTFESVGAAYLAYDSISGANIYSRSGASTESTLNFRASTFSFKIGGTQVSSLDSSSFSLYNTPILLSGSTSGYTGFAAPATSNFTIYTLPSADGTSGQSLTTNGSGTLSWASGTGGTVTSVSGTGTVSGISLSGTVTSSGSLTLGGSLDLSAYNGAGAFTTLSASSTVSGTGFSTYLASPPAIGGTAAAAGSFTTLSASSTVTLSGGTANGVAYLNGSKVVTSGSALTFNGSDMAIGGTNTNSARLALVDNSSNNFSSALHFRQTYAPTVYSSVYANFSGALVLSADIGNAASGTSDIEFFLSGSEKMRLTSTGLGIGTSSPSYKLDITASTAANGLRVRNTLSNIPTIVLGATDTANVDWTIQNNAGNLVFNGGSTGGNVGIGTSSPQTKLHVAQSASGVLFGQDSTTANIIGTNAAGTSSQGLFLKGFPLTFTGSGGGGTAQMTLNGDGNLGLGVTPSAWTSYKALQVNTGATLASTTNQMVLGSNWYYNSGDKYVTTDYSTIYIQNSGQHKWFTAPSGTAGNAITFTQAMTLDASGNLLVGATSSTYSTSGRGVIEVNGSSNSLFALKRAGAGSAYLLASSGEFQVNNTEATPMTFYVNGSERARIDSSGNLLVGTTSALGKVAIVPATSQFGAVVNAPSSSGTYYFHAFQAAGSGIGSITSTNGTATLYNTTSDERLKENIQDADSASTLIDSLKVRKFDWKSNNSHQRYGFVAQELAIVAPEAVYTPEDPEAMMAVDYSKLVPMLVKEIQSLRKRLADAGI